MTLQTTRIRVFRLFYLTIMSTIYIESLSTGSCPPLDVGRQPRSQSFHSSSWLKPFWDTHCWVSTCTCKSQCCSDGVYLTFSTRASIKLDANVGYPLFGCCALHTPVCCTCRWHSPYDAPAVHHLRPDTCVHCRVPVAGALPACQNAVPLW